MYLFWKLKGAILNWHSMNVSILQDAKLQGNFQVVEGVGFLWGLSIIDFSRQFLQNKVIMTFWYRKWSHGLLSARQVYYHLSLFLGAFSLKIGRAENSNSLKTYLQRWLSLIFISKRLWTFHDHVEKGFPWLMSFQKLLSM